MLNKRTKIVCTLGPASSSPRVMKNMIKAGMNCARINTAHGNFDQYTKLIKTLRRLAPIPVMIDIKGPEMRIRCDQKTYLKKGAMIKVGFSEKDPFRLNHDIYAAIKERDEVLFNDGLIRTVLVKKRNHYLFLKVLDGGYLVSGKGANVPYRELHLAPLSKMDLESIQYSKKIDAEFIAISFVRNKQDVLRVRKKVKGKNIRMISKIENFEGVENIDEIIDVSDGIMVARGDLGVEIPAQKVPMIQKEMIAKCNKAGKFVITATQMLESMIEYPIPTRAETSDIANAILDGSDAVMLSGETTVGKFPIRSVVTMTKVAHEVEPHVRSCVLDELPENITGSVARSAYFIGKTDDVDKVVCITKSGYNAALVSAFKLQKDIIALTHDSKVARQISLYYGVTPIVYEKLPHTEKVLKAAKYLYKKKKLKPKDFVLFTAGIHTTKAHFSNLVEIHQIGDLFERCKVRFKK